MGKLNNTIVGASYLMLVYVLFVCPLESIASSVTTAKTSVASIAAVNLSRTPHLPRTSARKKSQLFTFDTLPPSGFSMLTAKQRTIANVYFTGKFIGNFPVTFTDHYVKLDVPSGLIVAKMEHVKHKQQIITALTGKLALHAGYVCHSGHGKDCKVLNPKVAAVVFDSDTFQLTICVNKHFFTRALSPIHILPASRVGPSLSQQFTGVIAGSNSTREYSLFNRSTFGYKNAKINMAVFYGGGSYNKQAGGLYNYSNPADTLYIDELNAEYYRDTNKFGVGFLNNESNTLFPEQNFLGVSWKTTTDTIEGLDQAYGSLLQVYLTAPSQVAIMKDGRLLASGYYPAGNQILDTANLPDGAYNVTLLIRNGQGGEQRITRFFVKTSRLPPKGYPLYYFNVGALANNINHGEHDNFGPVFPHVQNTPFYQLGMRKRLNDWFGIGGGVAGTRRSAFLGSSLFFTGTHYQLDPLALLGSNGSFGVGLNYQLRFNTDFYASLYGRRLWAKNNANNIEHKNCYNSSFCPIAADTTTLTGGLGFPIAHNGSFNFNFSYDKVKYHAKNYSFGPTVTFNLNPRNRIPINLSLSANKNQSGWGAMLTLTTTFSSADHYSVSGTIGQGAGDNHGLIANATVSKSWLDSAQDGLTLQAGANRQSGNSSLHAGLDYTNGWGIAHADLTHNMPDNSHSSTQYSASYTNSIVWAGGKVGIGGGGNSDAGVLVNIKSNHKGKFEVLANDRVVKVVKTNHVTPVALPKFHTYRIRIRPHSKTNFAFDQRPKVVTLYEGNFKELEWSTHRKLILYTQVVDEHGKPVANSIVYGGSGFNYSDDDGTLQAEILDNTKNLTLYPSETTKCIVTVPPFKVKDDETLIEFKRLVCRAPPPS